MKRKNGSFKAYKSAFCLLISCSFFLILQSCQTKDSQATNETELLVDSVIVEPTYIYGFNADSVEVNVDTIHKNENLSEILSKYNVSMTKISELAEKSKEVFDVRGLRVDKKYEVICDPNDTTHTAKCFIYHPNRVEYVKYDLEDSVHVSLEHYRVDTVQNVISGVIESSMYQAMDSAGGSMALAWLLSDVYAWQINFYGLQKKDAFKVLYTELKVGDEVVGIDKILAAEFMHSGELYDAYWYEKDSIADYYNSKGESMRKSFLKAPLKYRRVSSKFSYRRFHPVHHVYRPHLGVDFAAPSGTPVVALGDGKISMASRGYNRGGGNMIKIIHNGTYTTGYLHLRSFAKGITPGKRVKQGEVIGYVGSTGASTGPHLDFRVWKDGKNINPLTMKPPAAKALTEEQIIDFKVVQAELFTKLQETPVL